MHASNRTGRGTAHRARQRAAGELDAIVESKLFRALCEPARIEVLKLLTIKGQADIATIAQHVPQDRSVVSRHLALLRDARLVRRQKRGRNVYFEVDGPAVVAQLEDVLERFRALVPLCCPADDGREGGACTRPCGPAAPPDGGVATRRRAPAKRGRS